MTGRNNPIPHWCDPMKAFEKLTTVATVRRRMKKFHQSYRTVKQEAIFALCVWWAHFTVEALNERGVRAVLQAGTSYWPRLRPEQDDGVSDNAFGYQFTPGEGNIKKLVMAQFPEMHCWAAIPATDEIIDLTAGFFPTQAKTLGGYDWPGEQPPSYLWCEASKIPEGVVYRPHMEAIKLAAACIDLYFTGLLVLPTTE